MKTFVILGGGIAGVSCAQELVKLFQESCRIILISATETLMESSSVIRITHHLEEISVFERTAEQFKLNNTGIEIIKGEVSSLSYEEKAVYLADGSKVHYDRLCICTGARPKLIHDHPNIIGLRDLQSIEELLRHLQSARRVVIVGNGGIALELIHQLHMCHIDWIIREPYIGSAFFDATASEFILPRLLKRKIDESIHLISPSSNTATTPTQPSTHHPPSTYGGYGLGPQWMEKSHFQAKLPSSSTTTTTSSANTLQIHFEAEVIGVSDTQGKSWTPIHHTIPSSTTLSMTAVVNSSSSADKTQENSQQDRMKDGKQSDFPLLLHLSNEQIIECDFVISATGVQPNTSFVQSSTTSRTIPSNSLSHILSTLSTTPTTTIAQQPHILLDEEGYILVNDRFQCFTQSDIFAAGDCCSYQPQTRSTTYFYQMKLWTQARMMGMYTAHCMAEVDEEYGLDAHFELFAHMTRFFGYKVVLLGRYNAQGYGEFIESAVKKTMVMTNAMTTSITTTTAETEEERVENTKETTTGQEHAMEIWIRIISEKEYIKVIVLQGKVIGALLIGDTDLEEVFENLILNQLDVSTFGIELLNPENDIEDFFD